MITKGTQEYKMAGEMARQIEVCANDTGYARYDRYAAQMKREFGAMTLRTFLEKVVALNVFASKIAESVLATMKPEYKKVALCSSKQAWCLACAAIENNIEFYENFDEE